MKNWIFCLLFLGLNVVATFLSAQDQLGLKLGNYTGINSVLLNPAHTAFSPFKWDVNLVALGVFAENNYAYAEKTSILQIAKNEGNLIFRGDLDPENLPEEPYDIFDYFDNRNPKFVHVNQFVMGPSAMFKIKGHTLGITTGFRTVVSAFKIPGSLSYYEMENRPLGESFDVGKFKLGVMAWSELGLNYATTIMKKRDKELAVGGSIKFLQGYEGLYVNNLSEASLSYDPGDTLNFGNVNLDYGFATNVQYEPGASEADYNFQSNGGGVSLDLGVEYKLIADEAPYKLKIGVSLLDIGRIGFGKNAQKHNLNLDSAFVVPLNEYETINNTEELVSLLSDHVFSNTSASLEGNKFGMWLPGALSVQADIRLTNMVFANITAIRRLPLPGPGVQRANIVALTPRFELKWAEFSLPLVLYNDSQFHMGAAFRLGPLSVGSDNLIGMFTKEKNLTGTDIYLAIKINPFLKRDKEKGYRRKHPKGKVKCPSFK